jgi:hypothetical protein
MFAKRWKVSRSIIALGIFIVTVGVFAGFDVVTYGQSSKAVAVGAPSTAKPTVGVPEDWSHHHLIFSNPGTFADAMKSGSFEKWYRAIADPRFNFQKIKRGGVTAAAQPSTGGGMAEDALLGAGGNLDSQRGRTPKGTVLKRDWSNSLGGAGVAAGVYPAKWQFFTSTTPSCSDYVVFGVNKAGVSGSGGQPNIVGLYNLYNSPTCSGTNPEVLFSYYVGTGVVQTSPVLGPSANQVAYVESISAGSKLHVLKGAGTGSSNGTIAAPVAPGTGNNATDVAVKLCTTSACTTLVSVTRSSPFYDYTHDVAYVGDDGGLLHKITGVFTGTPAEVYSSSGANIWPATVSTKTSKILTSPVYDSASTRVYVGDASGYLYSVNSTTGSGTSGVTTSGQVGAGTGIVAPPIVDSTAESVYVFVGENAAATHSAVVAFSISTGNIVASSTGTSTATLGTNSATVPLYAGTFDNSYFTSSNHAQPLGNLYVCGNAGGNPTLYQVPITYSSGPSLPAGGTAGPVLAGGNFGCSPVTEFYNTSGTPTDWLFAGVAGNSCGANVQASTQGGCVMSFNLTSSGGSWSTALGPWTPATAYASGAEIVDTSGRIQKCTGGGCGVTNETSGVVAPTWTATTTTEPGTGGSLDVANVSCPGGTTCTGATIDMTNITANTLSITTNDNSNYYFNGSNMASPFSLTSGATVGIQVAESSSGHTGDNLVIGPVTYAYETVQTGGTITAVVVDDFSCSSCHPQMNENLFAAITGLKSNCTYNSGAICFSPWDQLVWTSQGAGNGQATEAQPTGTGGIIIDNAGSSTGEANIYFGTLSGIGATNFAIKLSQAALQ